MPHPGSDYQDWTGEPLPADPHRGATLPWLKKTPVSCADPCDDDAPPSIESLVELCIPMARRMAASRIGADPEELESEATYALFLAARSHAGRGLGHRVFKAYARKKIRAALDEFEACNGLRLLGVPKELKRAARKVAGAVACFARRGIHRPTALQIAGETLLGLEVVEEVLAIPSVISFQAAPGYQESRSVAQGYVPTLVPLFGPQPGFTPQTTCDHVHRGPIPHGSPLCCMAGNESGMDHHPALRRDRSSDPKPEPKRRAAAPPVPNAGKPHTRREKRQNLFPPA